MKLGLGLWYTCTFQYEFLLVLQEQKHENSYSVTIINFSFLNFSVDLYNKNNV